MGKKGKKAQTGKPKKLTPKDIGKRLDVLAKKLEEELEGADLFAPLPPTEDCAICLVPLSRDGFFGVFQACCGNDICKACFLDNRESIKKQKNAGKKVAFTCPFCREPEPSTRLEYLRQLQARCLKNDHTAFLLMGNANRNGEYRLPKDKLKALDCWIRATELGSPEACDSIGDYYHESIGGLAINKDRAALFWRVGALRGSIVARHNVGCFEYNNADNNEIAIRHWKIAAEAGTQDSLDVLRKIYNKKQHGNEFITKEYLDFAYRACHGAQMEIKSEEREKHRVEE